MIGRTTEPSNNIAGMMIQTKKLDPIVKSRLHEEIVSQIQRKILAREFSIGEKLPPERDLASDLKVNRATLREALKKLELLGLVEIRHGDGIYVQNYLESGNLELFRAIVYMDNNLTLPILKGILEIRRIIVPEMAYHAAAIRSDAELAELRMVIEKGEPSSVLERDLTVHRIVARASGNLFYVFILNFFNQLFREYGHIYFDDPENSRRSEKFHRDLCDAMQEKKPEKARRIMKDVLIFTENRIYEFYTRNMGRLPDRGSVK